MGDGGLVVIVPTRGRPDRARTLTAAFRATCTADTSLVLAVDDSDSAAAEYATLDGAIVERSPSTTMVEALNAAAVAYAATAGVAAIGFMGDDHLPRTPGWDRAYLDALAELGTGVVYGNDLLQGHRLPTQCAMTADIVTALGYMAPPALVHLFVDNVWKAWGAGIGRLRYLPQVIVEHRHPLAGKAAWDDGYQRVNGAAVAGPDEATWTAYAAEGGGLDADLATLHALLGCPVSTS